jgi:hypothetical protein
MKENLRIFSNQKTAMGAGFENDVKYSRLSRTNFEPFYNGFEADGKSKLLII